MASEPVAVAVRGRRLWPAALGVKALAFWLSLLAGFFAAPYANLFFLLLSFLTVLAALAVVSTWRNLRGVEAVLGRIEPFPAGGVATGSAELRAADRAPRFALDLELAVTGQRGWHNTSRLGVLRGGARIDVALPALTRGVWPVRGVRIASCYPFGFLRVVARLTPPPPLIVYPAPAHLGNAQSRRELLAALCGTSAALQGEMGPSGLRPWRDGDELRRVHWKATARRGEPVVREWESDALAGIEVCLDLRADAAELEQALSVLAALALWAQRHKEVLALRAQDATATFGEGHRPWAELLAYLAAARPLAEDGPPPPRVSPGVLRLPARAGSALPEAAHA